MKPQSADQADLSSAHRVRPGSPHRGPGRLRVPGHAVLPPSPAWETSCSSGTARPSGPARGQHTGRTDIPLTAYGERQAASLAPAARPRAPRRARSPRRSTARAAPPSWPGCTPEVDADLIEWDNGDVRGPDHRRDPRGPAGWWLWTDGAPGGEDWEQVGARCARTLDRVAPLPTTATSRCSATGTRCGRWRPSGSGLPAWQGGLFTLDAASLSVLGHYRGHRVVKAWNDVTARPAPAGTGAGCVRRRACRPTSRCCWQLVRELAAYEREPDAVEATEADLHRALFGDARPAPRHVAGRWTGEVVGFALWYPTFSTWTGQPGCGWRTCSCARTPAAPGSAGRCCRPWPASASSAGWPRLEWWVLDWNAPAIGFYRALGAVPQDEWTTFRVDGTGAASPGLGQAAAAAVPGERLRRAPAQTERDVDEREEQRWTSNGAGPPRAG